MDLVTAYTPDVPYYAAAATRFRESCARLGVVPRIATYPDTGDWLENCRRKPFLIAALRRTGHSLLWVDVDNVVEALPEEPRDVEFAGVKSGCKDGRLWWAGALYFGHHRNERDVLECWVRVMTYAKEISDERALDSAFPMSHTSDTGRWAYLHAPGIRPGLSKNAARYANRGTA